MRSRRPERMVPGPGQESVWDYPRPPDVRPLADLVRVVHAGLTVADTVAAAKVCETSQLPAYYLPPADVRVEWLVPSANRSFCEWKGVARYWHLAVPDAAPVADAAWSYDEPTAPYASITGYVAFYARSVDECWVGADRVQPNPGSFYGGWWTPTIVGPFKGEPGTLGW